MISIQYFAARLSSLRPVLLLAAAGIFGLGITGHLRAGSTTPLVALGEPQADDANFGNFTVSADGQTVLGYGGIFDRANKLVTFENHDGLDARCSADGRYVVFSARDDLTRDPTDTNGFIDIFLLDRQSGATTRISVGPGGVQANGDCGAPRISGDGRYIVFSTFATNLTSDSTSGDNVLVLDRNTGSLFRLGLGYDALELSADGSTAVFLNDNHNIQIASLAARTTSTLPMPTTDGLAPNGLLLYGLSISGDGKTVLFDSNSSNLVVNDHNPGGSGNVSELFIYHVQTETITRVLSYAGGDPDGTVDHKFCVSDDGRFIAFSSNATNLVPYDTNGQSDLFLLDQQTAQITRITVANDGTETRTGQAFPSNGCMTADGRYIFYQAQDSLISGVVSGVEYGAIWRDVVYDRLGPTLPNPTVVTTTNLSGVRPSGPTPIAGTLQTPAGLLKSVAVGDEGAGQGGLFSFSSNGRFATYYESTYGGGNYYGDSHLYLSDLQTGKITDVLPAAATTTNIFYFRDAAVSDDGRYVFFSCTDLLPNDTNGFEDIFVFDTQLGTYTKITKAGNGTQTNGDSRFFAITPDGAYVAFQSDAKDLIPSDTNGTTDVFLYTVATGVTELVSVNDAGEQGNNFSDSPAISADGRYVAFRTRATNLAPGNTTGKNDICVRDRTAKTTTRVNLRSDGYQFNSDCAGPIALGQDAEYIAFTSTATNVNAADQYGFNKVYWRNLTTGETREVTHAPDGSAANADSGQGHLSISADGGYVAFASNALNLTPQQNNGTDIFLYDAVADTNRRLSIVGDGSASNGDSNDLIINATGRYVIFASAATNLGANNNVNFALYSLDLQSTPNTHPEFFTGEAALGNGAYYLKFPNGNPFGYYSYLSDSHYIYHFDMGYEYVFDAADAYSGVYLYDFKSGGFFYTSPTFPFPYLYDFTLNTVLYYYPNPSNPDHYNTNGKRYFYDFATGKIISK